MIRNILYGSPDARAAPIVCRWKIQNINGREIETPPSEQCKPDRLDLALQVNNPTSFDPTTYITAFSGNVDRIHICRNCKPDAVIEIHEPASKSHAYSLQGLLILYTAYFNQEIADKLVVAAQGVDNLKDLLGERFFHVAGFRQVVTISGFQTCATLVFQVGLTIIIALWLGLKAHSRILDYFARNGALLPLVSATGAEVFYGALWILSILRVALFLLASIPMVIFWLSDIVSEKQQTRFIGDSLAMFGFWLFALITSLLLASVVSSTGQLKMRHSLLSFCYRYLPLILAGSGAIIWGLTFLIGSENIVFVRQTITALPIVGILPILVAPIFKPIISVLFLHILLSAMLTTYLFKRNAQWFAAHLESL